MIWKGWNFNCDTYKIIEVSLLLSNLKNHGPKYRKLNYFSHDEDEVKDEVKDEASESSS